MLMYDDHNIDMNRAPKGYEGDNYPMLVYDNKSQEECCPHCLCNSCIIARPPDFLTGSATPALSNMRKRYTLYRKFWQLLKEIGLWQCERYLQRKQGRTARDDPREIIPQCIIMVCILLCVLVL